MDTDDLEPKKPKPEPKKFDEMSIADLKAYIGELESEIERARAAIAAKENARAGADTFFKT